MAADLALNAAVARLSADARSRLSVLWPKVRNAYLAGEALNDILPGLIDLYGSTAAGLAADWYDDLRERYGVPGSFAAVPADLPDTGSPELVGWAQSEISDPSDMTAFEALISGGVQRRIANWARRTVMQSSIADPHARGWQRIGRGDSCSFCTMLISRGAVYTESSVDFGSHDHCDCGAQPAWGGKAVPVKPHVPTDRDISDADRARVRAWIDANL